MIKMPMALLLLVLAASSAYSQDDSATIFGKAFSQDNNLSQSANGTAVLLDGSTGDQQGFLSAFNTAVHKGQFICDNIGQAQAQSTSIVNGNFSFIVRGARWP